MQNQGIPMPGSLGSGQGAPAPEPTNPSVPGGPGSLSLMSEPPPQPQEPVEGEPNVSPEEQAMYEAVVQNAAKLIYSDAGMKEVFGILKGADDHAQAIGQFTALVGDQIYQQAMKSNRRIPEDVLVHAATEIIDTLFDFGMRAGVIKDVSDDDRLRANAYAQQAWVQSHKDWYPQDLMKMSMQQMREQQPELVEEAKGLGSKMKGPRNG